MNGRQWHHAILAFLVSLVASTTVLADSGDPFQRYLKFRNSLATPIYPVIESPQSGTTNCGFGGLLRIVVNKDVKGAGIPPGETVVVALPKRAPCEIGGFYDASRIYVLGAPFDAVEALLTREQRTEAFPGWDYANYSPCPGCWVGIAGVETLNALGGAYGYDVPGQLLEYTMISQDPNTGEAFADPNNVSGAMRQLLDSFDCDVCAGTGFQRRADGGFLLGPEGRRLRCAEGPWSWVTSHTFRKTVATRLDEAGLTPRQVADQLGHANPSMTLDIYFGRQVVSADAARVLDR